MKTGFIKRASFALLCVTAMYGVEGSNYQVAAQAGRQTVRSAVRLEPLSSSKSYPSLLRRAAAVEPLMFAAAREYGVDPRLLWTIAYLETRFQSSSVSPKGARGMMQFIPSTAARYGLVNPHDDAASIDAAARYVRDLTRRFGNRFELILAGYNAGEGAVDAHLRGYSIKLADGRVINSRKLKTGGIPPYNETRNYVAQGLLIARGLVAHNSFVRLNLPTSVRSPQAPALQPAALADTTPEVIRSFKASSEAQQASVEEYFYDASSNKRFVISNGRKIRSISPDTSSAASTAASQTPRSPRSSYVNNFAAGQDR